MLVHLATFNDPFLDQPAAAFYMHASTDRIGTHQLTDSPQLADIILFTQCHMFPGDWRLETIRRHRLTREFREKVMVYNECDRPWCALPGVYVNMPARRFVPAHQRPWPISSPRRPRSMRARTCSSRSSPPTPQPVGGRLRNTELGSDRHSQECETHRPWVSQCPAGAAAVLLDALSKHSPEGQTYADGQLQGAADDCAADCEEGSS